MDHDQKVGGSFNAHKNWKKLRDKHRKHDSSGKGGTAPPEQYIPYGGAGKGDMERKCDVSKEVYDLNYDLAFGRISTEEHTHKLKELMENE